MKRRLMIEGNAVYEIDEDCMLVKRMEEEEEGRIYRNSEESVETNGRKREGKKK